MIQTVIRGNPITLEALYKLDNGTLSDPTNPRVSIFNPSNTAVVSGATPTRVSTGDYTFTYSVDIAAPIGIWNIQWQGTVESQGLGPIPEYFEVLPVGAIAPIFNGSYTYDLGTNVGQVRMYIDDRDISSVSSLLPLEQRSAIFTDEEITSMLSQVSNDVMYASALALVTISGNRQLLVQSRRIGKTAVDYGQVRKSLQDQATALVTMSNMKPADGVSEIAWNDFGFRQILLNVQLRQAL